MVRVAAEARRGVKTKRQRLHRNVGFERNLEVENLTDFHKQGRLSVFICYFSVLSVSLFPSACLHNLSPLSPLCFPFLTVLITPHLLPNPTCWTAVHPSPIFFLK